MEDRKISGNDAPPRILSVFHFSVSRLLLAVLLLAVVARGAVLWKWSGRLTDAPGNDVDQYLEIAKHVASGDGYANDRGATAYRPPLYPLLLAAVGAPLFGAWAVGAAHLILGTLTVLLTVRLGQRLGLGRWSFLAGTLVAVDPLLLNATASLMTETLAAFLAVCLLNSQIRAPEEWTLRRALTAGLLNGVAFLCRPAFLPFIPLVWLVSRRRRAFGDREQDSWFRQFSIFVDSRSVYAAVFLAGFFAALLPWAARNFAVFDRMIWSTTHGGYTLLLAHNPVYYDQVVRKPWGTVWDGQSLAAWSKNLEAELARETPPLDLRPGEPVAEFARDRWMTRRAVANILADPLMALRSGLTLWGRFWNVVPLAEQGRLPGPVRWGIGLFYAALFVAAIMGLFKLGREDWPIWWPAAGLILTFTLIHFVYWADMRMRAPLEPALALLAARALVRRSK